MRKSKQISIEKMGKSKQISIEGSWKKREILFVLVMVEKEKGKHAVILQYREKFDPKIIKISHV